eukprot:38293-Eustigmatos_ZCMA.PRE.1
MRKSERNRGAAALMSDVPPICLAAIRLRHKLHDVICVRTQALTERSPAVIVCRSGNLIKRMHSVTCRQFMSIRDR